jgi:hypothetical protein
MSKKSQKPEQMDNVIKVIGVPGKGGKATREWQQEIMKFGALGKEVRISPKANLTVNVAGFSVKYYVETVEVLIGIGKDHTASLIMDIDAWKALNAGEEISITTNKEFKKNFL